MKNVVMLLLLLGKGHVNASCNKHIPFVNKVELVICNDIIGQLVLKPEWTMLRPCVDQSQ